MAVMEVRIRNVSSILIGINIFFFILQLVIPGFTEMFVLVSSEVLARPWILLTSMFLHGGFGHLLFNMYALLVFGPLIEQRIGTKRFLGVYFAAGLLGALAFTIFEPLSSALGASGAIMGIIGIVIMLLPKLKVLLFFAIPMSMRTAGILFALFDLVGFVGGGSGIAHVAHLGGLLIGVLYGWYLLSQKKSFTRRFTAKGPSRANRNRSRTSGKDYEKTIELKKDDLDDYYKYGRL